VVEDPVPPQGGAGFEPHLTQGEKDEVMDEVNALLNEWSLNSESIRNTLQGSQPARKAVKRIDKPMRGGKGISPVTLQVRGLKLSVTKLKNKAQRLNSQIKKLRPKVDVFRQHVENEVDEMLLEDFIAKVEGLEAELKKTMSLIKLNNQSLQH
jgi:predicted transcriptional regulator